MPAVQEVNPQRIAQRRILAYAFGCRAVGTSMRRWVLALLCAVASNATAQTDELLGAGDASFSGRSLFEGPGHVAAELDRAGRSLAPWRYVPIDHDVIALLGAGEGGRRETYRLDAGREYMIQAACDRMCGDIDIELIGPNGALVAADASDAIWPAITFTPPATGGYVVRLRVKRCAVDYCYAGVRVYGRAE
jgi:hypothetical protein